jgi:hypothetical protein
MPEPMTLHRFQELADAYGGAITRWPALEREAAMLIASHPAALDILAGASMLDDTLDAWRVSAPAIVLRDRLVGDASRQAKNAITRMRLWWSGVGIAAALAGAASGTAAIAMAAPVDVASDGGTSFGDVGAQDS